MVKESGWITQSIHQTRKGAEQALEDHKNELFREWNDEHRPEPFGIDQDWRICEFELLD